MDDFDPIVPETQGNTKPASLRKNWCFTLNNYSQNETDDLMFFCSINCKLYILGYEVGENGTPHIQGFISLKSKCRMTTLKKRECFGRAHLEFMRGTIMDNLLYCSKSGNYVTNHRFPLVIKTINEIELYPWQLSLESMLFKEPDSRAIIWIYDPHTNNGKTGFMKYYCKKNKCPFSYGGAGKDIINLVLNNKNYFQTTEKATMFFNFTKQIDVDMINYSAFEQIKDGCISNVKYEAECFLINTPHIVVFANELPRKSNMGEKRFNIYTINNERELMTYTEPVPLRIIASDSESDEL